MLVFLYNFNHILFYCCLLVLIKDVCKRIELEVLNELAYCLLLLIASGSIGANVQYEQKRSLDFSATLLGFPRKFEHQWFTAVLSA